MSFSKKTMLYFAPHQDDELLSMGIDICASLEKKYDVHVILCTDGSRSNMRKVIANGKTCKKHEGIHCYELSVEEFVQARDREFTGSCLALGVPEENIHIPENRAIDGSLYISRGEALIRSFVSRFDGDVEVRTISPTNGPDQHPDHKNLGRAADNLLKAGEIRKVRFFVEPYLFEKIRENPRLIPTAPTIQQASASVAQKITEAVDSYSLWLPEQRRYAVGFHSVTTEFQDFLKIKACYSFDKFHPTSMTEREKLYERHRKWLKLKNQKQLYYSCAACEKPDLGQLQLINIQAQDTAGYVNFCGQYNVELREKDLQRIADGSSFWCLTSEDKEVLSSGWLAHQQDFYIGETDFGFHMGQSDSAILYDFNTVPSQRGKGLYGLLLRGIVCKASHVKRFIIYTAPDNYSSSRGILKAGFHFDGALSAADNSMKRYLKQHGFERVYRKNRLWGLWVSQ